MRPSLWPTQPISQPWPGRPSTEDCVVVRADTAPLLCSSPDSSGPRPTPGRSRHRLACHQRSRTRRGCRPGRRSGRTGWGVCPYGLNCPGHTPTPLPDTCVTVDSRRSRGTPRSPWTRVPRRCGVERSKAAGRPESTLRRGGRRRRSVTGAGYRASAASSSAREGWAIDGRLPWCRRTARVDATTCGSA